MMKGTGGGWVMGGLRLEGKLTMDCRPCKLPTLGSVQ